MSSSWTKLTWKTFFVRISNISALLLKSCHSVQYLSFAITRTFGNYWQICMRLPSCNHEKTLGNFVLFIWSKFKVTSNLAAENLALRQQLVVMKWANKRPKIRMAERLFWVLLFRICSPWCKSLIIVGPDTVVRWHRKGFKLFWKFKSNTPQGVLFLVLVLCGDKCLEGLSTFAIWWSL